VQAHDVTYRGADFCVGLGMIFLDPQMQRCAGVAYLHPTKLLIQIALAHVLKLTLTWQPMMQGQQGAFPPHMFF
jgi:hypothetical protein